MAASKPTAKKAAKPTPVVANKATTPKAVAKPAVKAKVAAAAGVKKADVVPTEITNPILHTAGAAPEKAAPLAAKPAAKASVSKHGGTVATQPASKPQAPAKAGKEKAPVAPAPKSITPEKEIKTEKNTPPPTIIMPTKKKEETKPTKITVPKTSVKTAVKYEPDFMKSVLDASVEPEAPIAPTMRYSDNDLTEFRELINRKLDAAKKELNYLQGLITRKDEMGGDNDDARYMTMEDGSLSMEREQLSQMASRQITFVDHLEKALMRIESKTYGVCRVTGKLIDKARLRAVPHATLSVEAKMGKVRLP
ncbi:MAG: TraR/DksA C4-type zinc finger protein [Chitinophagaceae bacterium]